MMYQSIIQKLTNKKIAIVGFGREGKSTYNFIKSENINTKEIFILDKNVNLILENPFLKEETTNIKFILGDSYLDNLDSYDVIIKTPGISFNHLEIDSFKDKITSQMALFLECFRDQIIGITGTKGKSTTSSLIYSIFREQDYDAYLLGNIGIPVFDYLDQFKVDSILIVEMSAYQLEYVSVSPMYGIVLNLFEEHLDYFGTLDKYYLAKLNMFKYQLESDYGLYFSGNKLLSSYVDSNNYLSHLIGVSVDDSLTIKRNLLGEHNLIDIMFSLKISELFNLDSNKTYLTISNFKGLEHRLELVGDYDGVTYYNDSIATIPEATIYAVETLDGVDTLIFGGMNRGIDYGHFITFLSNSNIRNLIALPDTGYMVLDKLVDLGTDKGLFYAKDLGEAVGIAKAKTLKGKICLLSPAAPSYNSFKNFEEKGKAYKNLVIND